MESEPASKPPPIYVSRRKSVRTDMLTRQALVPPIFRRREPAKREGKYSKVHSCIASNGESQCSASEAYRNALYLKYKTDFNYLSPELLANQKFSGLEGKHRRAECNSDTDLQKHGEKRRRSKKACTEFQKCLPNSPWLNRMLPVLLRTMRPRDGVVNDKSKACVKDEVLQLYKSGQKFEEEQLRDTATILSSIMAYIDNWRDNARAVISQRITIEEARSLMEEFRELSGGLVRVDLATEIDNDIKTCEAFGAKVRMTMTTLSSSTDRTVSLEEVESLLQESRSCRFLVPEVVALQSIFSNLISLRSLMESSVLELDLPECETLVSVCEKGLVRLPKLDELRRRLQESVWLHSASKVCQRQVKYTLARSLMDNVPDVLREHRLYSIVKQKCLGMERWLERISQYSFFQLVSSDHACNALMLKKDSASSAIQNTSAVTGVKCDARVFEELCAEYHQMELTLPVFRSIEPLYQSLKRLQKRLHKIEAMLDSNSRNPNMATDCLLLLQHSEPLSELIDLTQYLLPIRQGVEVWLSYEKKCRKVLDTVKTFTLSREFNRLKTDWGFLLNFRKTTKLSDSDLAALMELMRAYEEEDRVAFSEVKELEAEFVPLRIKNLVLQREISEIYEKGTTLSSKVETALENVKADKSKSDSVISHVVLVILEVLKFGAKIDHMPSLLVCIEYLRWSRDFYSFIFSNEAMEDGGKRLRELAGEGARTAFHEITDCVGVHERVLNQVYGLGCLPKAATSPHTELELLRLLVV